MFVQHVLIELNQFFFGEKAQKWPKWGFSGELVWVSHLRHFLELFLLKISQTDRVLARQNLCKLTFKFFFFVVVTNTLDQKVTPVYFDMLKITKSGVTVFD